MPSIDDGRPISLAARDRTAAGAWAGLQLGVHNQRILDILAGQGMQAAVVRRCPNPQGVMMVKLGTTGGLSLLRPIACLLAGSLLLTVERASTAATGRPAVAPVAVADPGQFQCVGRNRYSGAINIPEEKQSETGAWSYAVMLVDPVQGRPIIIYGPRFREVSPLMQAFIRRHECQHANGVVDEIAANCVALVQMRALGLTSEQEGQLEQWHLTKGQLDPQYGGSGAVFWERTLRCAAAVR